MAPKCCRHVGSTQANLPGVLRCALARRWTGDAGARAAPRDGNTAYSRDLSLKFWHVYTMWRGVPYC